MASSGPLLMGSVTLQNDGPIDFVNESNALVNDDTTMDSVAGMADSDITERAHFLNASHSIPSGATIDGIVVSVRFKGTEDSGSGTDISISAQLIKGGTRTGDVKGTAAYSDNTLRSVDIGGAADKWSVTLTDTDIGSTFGVAIQANASGSSKTTFAHIAWVKMTVYYTEGGGGGGGGTSGNLLLLGVG